MGWNDDIFVPCDLCGEEEPEGVLEDGLCPACCDLELEDDDQ